MICTAPGMVSFAILLIYLLVLCLLIIVHYEEETFQSLSIAMNFSHDIKIDKPVFQHHCVLVSLNFIFIHEFSFAEFCDVPELLSHLETNYNFWKDREESGLVNIQEEDETNESIS